MKNNTNLWTGILIGMLTVVGTILSSPANLVFAAGVFCPPCEGTEGNDTISGSKADDRMEGNGGNDRMSGQGGNDRMDGGVGHCTERGFHVEGSNIDKLLEHLKHRYEVTKETH